MDGFKSLLSSKTIWGALVAMFAGGLSLAGYSISAEDQALSLDLIAGAASTFGGAFAIYGRVKATKRIG